MLIHLADFFLYAYYVKYCTVVAKILDSREESWFKFPIYHVLSVQTWAFYLIFVPYLLLYKKGDTSIYYKGLLYLGLPWWHSG